MGTISAHSSGGPSVAQRNPYGVIYVHHEDGTDEAWRLKIVDPLHELSIQKFEPLDEAGITLNEAKVTSIEGNSIYTASSPYFASVATDGRSDTSTPAGINGDTTGRFIEWDGFVWQNFVEQWVEKVSFAESVLSHRGIFRRMNVIETDPNDPTRHPPQPDEGTTIGSRNTQSDGLGLELLSFNDKNGSFGQLLEMIHGTSAELIDQIQGIKADATLIGVPYELAHVAGTTYAIGDVVVDQGVRYSCNTAGLQSGVFSDESSKWDANIDGFSVNDILTNASGEVLVNSGGNVLVSG